MRTSASAGVGAALVAFDTARFGIEASTVLGFLLAADPATDFFATFLTAAFFTVGFFSAVFATGFPAVFFTAAVLRDAGLRDAAADFPGETTPALFGASLPETAFFATGFFFAVAALFVAGFFVAADVDAAADLRATGFFAAAFFFTGALVLRFGAGLMSYLQFTGMREAIRSRFPRSAQPV